ncbi:MAG: HAD hydrolase-like protein [Verrucomicrobiota bacterium]
MRNVIFDLDGTLVDSLPGIEYSARTAIGSVLPGVPLPDLKAIIGPPVATMFARLWPDLDPEKMAQLVAAFRSHYVEKGCLDSRPFHGVTETLSCLQAAGLRMFVLTNKPAAPTKTILRTLGLAEFFAGVLAPDSPESPFASKPDGARALMRRFALDPGQTTLVGDGADDAASAEACGFRFIAAAYGYGAAAATAATRVEKFSEIERYLLSLPA